MLLICVDDIFKFVGTYLGWNCRWFDLRLCGFTLSFFPLPKKTEGSIFTHAVSKRGPAESEDLSGGVFQQLE